MVYFPEFETFFELEESKLDLLEVEPQTHWTRSGGSLTLNERSFSKLNHLRQRKLVHGVGMPLATTLAFDPQQFDPWRESIKRLQPPWLSEHLAFMRVPDPSQRLGSVHSGFLLPALQSRDMVALAAEQIRTLQHISGVPVAFETSPNYLRPQRGELVDGEFYARVAEQADCGILLDLHNLWCNERNGRQTMREVLRCLPIERVWEIHLAGGEQYNGYYLDAHSDLVPTQILDVCEEWMPKLPNLGALIFEIMPDYVHAKKLGHEDLAGQIEVMRALWFRHRHTSNGRDSVSLDNSFSVREPHYRRASISPDRVQSHDWELALGSLVNRRAVPPGVPHFDLGTDPGVEVLASLVDSFRAGTLAEGLTLSYRLLVLTLGDEPTSELISEFWLENWPQPLASDEIDAFVNFLLDRIATARLTVPFLGNVLDYELAFARSVQTGTELWVHFDCEPLALLGSLSRGVAPKNLTHGQYEMYVSAGASSL